MLENLYYKRIKEKDEIPFDLLLLADPSEIKIEEQIRLGEAYKVYMNKNFLATYIITEHDKTKLEITHLAVLPSYQRKGYAKQILRDISNLALLRKYKKLIIGTGNSSIGQLALYQKEGFDIVDIEKNYFLDHYDFPIVENEIHCKHRILLEKVLS